MSSAALFLSCHTLPPMRLRLFYGQGLSLLFIYFVARRAFYMLARRPQPCNASRRGFHIPAGWLVPPLASIGVIRSSPTRPRLYLYDRMMMPITMYRHYGAVPLLMQIGPPFLTIFIERQYVYLGRVTASFYLNAINASTLYYCQPQTRSLPKSCKLDRHALTKLLVAPHAKISKILFL